LDEIKSDPIAKLLNGEREKYQKIQIQNNIYEQTTKQRPTHHTSPHPNTSQYFFSRFRLKNIQLKTRRSEHTPTRTEMAMARASSGLQYPERFYAAASYAGFDGDANSTFKALTSKFSKESAALLYGLYQQVRLTLSIHCRSDVFRFRNEPFRFSVVICAEINRNVVFAMRNAGQFDLLVCVLQRCV
jgi:hypothetical protein